MKNRESKLGEVVLYRTRDGKTALDVRLEGDTVWLTQAQMAKLFENTKQNISLHTRNIFREGELSEKAVVKESLTTAPDGKKYSTKAAHLLYFVIKNHPFSDGNKRIGSLLFVDFLNRNGQLFRNGEAVINDVGLPR